MSKSTRSTRMVSSVDEALKRVLLTTWQAVGSDALAACAEAGEQLDNETAIEVVLDASRAEAYARTDEEKAALAALRKHTWGEQVARVKLLVGRLV
jgi:hypothetical protein